MIDRVQAQSHRAHETDPALVEACLNGDSRAWDELVERYGRLVYSIPRRMGFSATDADDVFQEVFATLLRSVGSLRDRTRLSAWLITTTRRECWRRGRATMQHAELDESLADGAPAALDEIARWEQEQGVREAVRQLDDRCRELLMALFLDASNPSYEAIAARLGMPVGSIGPTRALLQEIGSAVARDRRRCRGVAANSARTVFSDRFSRSSHQHAVRLDRTGRRGNHDDEPSGRRTLDRLRQR